MWAAFISFLVELISSLTRTWMSEKSRDISTRETVKEKANKELLIKKNEKAENAKKVSNAIGELTDDQLDDKLRGKRS